MRLSLSRQSSQRQENNDTKQPSTNKKRTQVNKILNLVSGWCWEQLVFMLSLVHFVDFAFALAILENLINRKQQSESSWKFLATRNRLLFLSIFLNTFLWGCNRFLVFCYRHQYIPVHLSTNNDKCLILLINV